MSGYHGAPNFRRSHARQIHPRKTHSRSPRPEHLERRESVHRLARRRPVRPGPHRSALRGRRDHEGKARAATSPSRRCSSARSARCGCMLDEMDSMWLPVERSWRLNERHYGALQGLNKAQTVEKHGEAQVKIWRRSYDIPPPPLSTRRPAPSGSRCALRGSRSARAARVGIAEGHAGARAAVLERPHRRRSSSSGKNVMVAAHGNQPARDGEDARQRDAKRRSPSSTSRPACRWCTSWTRR